MGSAFQLFYTHASGHDPAPTQAIAKLVAAHTPFTHALVDELQARFTLSKKVESAIGDLSFGMSGALSEVLDRVALAERDAIAYARTLSKASGELGSTEQSALELHKLVNTLNVATRAMETRTRSLEAELQRSSGEIGELKSKLDDVRKETLRVISVTVRRSTKNSAWRLTATGEPANRSAC